jgi:hypothetical protein
MNWKQGSVLLACVLLFCSACDDGGVSAGIQLKKWDCVELSCDTSFVIENSNDSPVKLKYQVSLYRSYDEVTKERVEIVVGEASGEIRLASLEKRTVVTRIAVTEKPNGMSAGFSTTN